MTTPPIPGYMTADGRLFCPFCESQGITIVYTNRLRCMNCGCSVVESEYHDFMNALVDHLQQIDTNARDEAERSILDILRGGELTRPEICERIHMPRTTVYDVLRLLLLQGKIVRHPIYSERQPRGRPKVAFALPSEILRRG